MSVGLKTAVLGCALGDDVAADAEYMLLAAIHDLVGTGVVRIGVLDDIIREQVVFQIGVRNGGRIDRVHITRLLEGGDPAVIDMLVGHGKRVGKAVFRDVFFDRGHQIVAILVINLMPPAEVVQTVVADLHLLAALEANHVGHLLFQINRHVADIEDLRVRTQAAGRFRDNGRRIGVIEHPCIRAVLFHVIEDLNHAADRAHAVGNAAGTTGFLTDNAVLERDLLILLAHCVLAHADVRQHEVDIGERCFGVGGVAELDVRRVLLQVDLARLGDDLLTFGVVVIEHDLADREPVALFEQHQRDTRGKGGAATGDGYCIFLVRHLNFLLTER